MIMSDASKINIDNSTLNVIIEKLKEANHLADELASKLSNLQPNNQQMRISLKEPDVSLLRERLSTDDTF